MITLDDNQILEYIEHMNDDSKAVLLFLTVLYSTSDPEFKSKLDAALEKYGLKVPDINEINWGTLINRKD